MRYSPFDMTEMLENILIVNLMSISYMHNLHVVWKLELNIVVAELIAFMTSQLLWLLANIPLFEIYPLGNSLCHGITSC